MNEEQERGFPIPGLTAPTRPLSDLSSADKSARILSVYGSAKMFSLISEYTRLEQLWLSGIRPETAVIVGNLTKITSLTIHDFRVPNFSAFSSMPNLRLLAVAGSPKLKSLDGLQSLAILETLILFDNCNYDDLEPIRQLANLTELCLEGGLSKQLTVKSLEPLSNLERLAKLRLASVRVEDKSLKPLQRLKSLKDVFIADSFSEAEMRGLAAALLNARGEFLDSYRE